MLYLCVKGMHTEQRDGRCGPCPCLCPQDDVLRTDQELLSAQRAKRSEVIARVTQSHRAESEQQEQQVGRGRRAVGRAGLRKRGRCARGMQATRAGKRTAICDTVAMAHGPGSGVRYQRLLRVDVAQLQGAIGTQCRLPVAGWHTRNGGQAALWSRRGFGLARMMVRLSAAVPCAD